MSKITFRADDDLVERVEALETSKSEVMREALRSYLDRERGASSRAGTGDDAGEQGETLDDLVADRVDALVESRLGEALAGPQDVNVTVTLETEGEPVRARAERVETGVGEHEYEAGDAPGVPREKGRERQCGQCGEALSSGHVYCPNCGEKASRRIFCECGDELRSDWAYCPGCGRRTPSADVLEG